MRTLKRAFLAGTALLAAATPAAAQQKKVITNAADLPPVQIQLPAKPSELAVQGGAGLEQVEDAVAAYVADLQKNYDIRDVATQRELLGLQLQDAVVDNRWDQALGLIERIRATEDKPASRAMSGLITGSYVRAAKAVGEGSPQFADRFEAELRQAVNALDWTLTQDALQSMRGQYQLISRDLIVGSLQGGLDPNAAAQGNKVGVGIASAVVGTHRTLSEMLPLKDRIFRVVDARVKSEATEKEDRWTARLVTLQPGQVKAPVTVAIWDGGTDPSVFPGQLWTNTREQQNGRDDDSNGFVDDVHGIAFDTDWKPSTGMLRPMPAEDLQGIGDKLKLVKGSLDLQAAVDSPEAAALRQTMSSLKPDQVMPFGLQQARLGLYLHGTATGYTSTVGNPGARVMAARFDYKIQPVPSPLEGKAVGEHARQAIDYFKRNGVRVVNMSWRITEPQIEAMLAASEPDPVKRKARARAEFEAANSAMETAFRGAPDILFVAGAGNEDEDVDFVRSFPAGINLPNVITVGAVDVALQPAGFTSYGKSIDLYANGFEVPSKVPGGMPINISGTSLAAPQVTNLAAKLLAVNPKLTAADLRRIMEETATSEGDKKLKVINPAAAMARVR